MPEIHDGNAKVALKVTALVTAKFRGFPRLWPTFLLRCPVGHWRDTDGQKTRETRNKLEQASN